MSIFPFKHQCTNRANINTFTAALAPGLANVLISKGGDHPSEATVGEPNLSYAQLFLAYPNAPAAEHALIGVVDKYGTAGIYG